MQNLGLLMTCNEADCIAEVMKEYVRYFDKILVLDGSSDKTGEIIQGFQEVKYFLKDSEIVSRLPGGKLRDGARQFLLAKAQELYGYDGWFTILHGDEIFYDNPLEMAELAEKEGAEKINWSVMNFFLHTSDQGQDLAATPSVQDRLTWYCPGLLEIRSFKNKKGLFYDLARHGSVTPHGIGWHMFSKFPVYKHYPYRSVDQMRQKRQQHASSSFSVSYDQLTDASFFRDILPGYKVARKFDGSFHEFELEQQGSILARWLRAHRYRHYKIGPFTI